MSATIFADRESAVRSYCRSWPVVFDRAAGSWLYDENERGYLDFFAGASALNYGHNDPVLKRALLDYIAADRVTHSLDMYTAAKREFLTALDEIILRPRGLDYRVQFPGPGGANAVEAALKLARKVTGRTDIVAFAGAFHGATLGALAVTGNALLRGSSGVTLTDALLLPFPSTGQHSTGQHSGDDAAEVGPGWLERQLAAASPDGDIPAGVIVEVVQGEGGINVARMDWLRGLAADCRKHGIVLIVDDVQMGCGRTGPFFSFEPADLTPDIVCLSKSIGGYGLPLALTLIRPDLDIWKPGEHSGTFRGVDPAFVTGGAALRTYWSDQAMERRTLARGERVAAALAELSASMARTRIEPRGRGMAHGLAFEHGGLAGKVASKAFECGLLVETCGEAGEVVKLLPPLTISDAELGQGLALLVEAVRAVC
ncbi:MAG TPA: diaminobutyrate--2-oxoglutarate transaminase [Streptosporangiaceae bacterium]